VRHDGNISPNLGPPREWRRGNSSLIRDPRGGTSLATKKGRKRKIIDVMADQEMTTC